mmetsp:Transcript_21060/g.29529  ORF Transcript_21060/g.29529 Transcript_21060/m.29529 type:complete len:138 (-) Transcript_21060:71-484(-)
MKESQQSTIELQEDLPTFSTFLQFFYTQSLDTATSSINDNNNSIDLIHLLKLADQYDVSALKKACLSCLSDQSLADLTPENILDFLLIGLEMQYPEIVTLCAQHLINFFEETVKPLLSKMDDRILVLLKHVLHFYPL